MAEDIRSLGIRLDQIISTTNTAAGNFTLNNGDQVVFTIATQSGSGAKILANPDMALYVGSVDSANQLPGGASVDESQWQVIGPWYDLASTNGLNLKTNIYIRNISAGTQTVYIQAASRVIVNSATPSAT